MKGKRRTPESGVALSHPTETHRDRFQRQARAWCGEPVSGLQRFLDTAAYFNDAHLPCLASLASLQRWDDTLAAFAKAYAQKCVWGHNKERGRRGENLFAITDEGMDVPLAVGNWHEEHEYYNVSTATCDPGQMCGHYTQVTVWAGGRAERGWDGELRGEAS